jgi:hypothetical protein
VLLEVPNDGIAGQTRRVLFPDSGQAILSVNENGERREGDNPK